MRITRRASLFGAALAASGFASAGCAGRPGRPPNKIAQGHPLRELPPQTVEPGGCALFLWDRRGEPRRIMMLSTDRPTARVALIRGVEEFPQTQASGTPVLGFFPKQTFRNFGVDLILDLKITAPENLRDGALVESGTLEYVSPEGWSVVTPVAGLIGCERR